MLDTPYRDEYNIYSEAAEMTRSSDNAPWRSMQLRFSAFSNAGQSAPYMRNWWYELIGTPPETISEEPRTNTVQLQGRSEGSPLLMRAVENRIDFLQQFMEQSAPMPAYSDVLPSFENLAVRWLKLGSHPPINRLAFGAVVAKPANRIEECRDVLDSYLPSIDMQKTALNEFLYQVNRRRKSKTIHDLQVNRLMKWSIQTIQQIDIKPSGVSATTVGLNSLLEVDINSAPEHTNLVNRDRLVSLLKEFVGLAEEIMTDGDHN